MIKDYQAIIDKYYPAEGGDPLCRDIYMKHACQVADMAVALNEAAHLGLDADMVRGAAMLHDIGICRTKAPGIHCHGEEPYIRHGVIGAEILRSEGAPENGCAWPRHIPALALPKKTSCNSNLPCPHATICRKLCWRNWYAMPINSTASRVRWRSALWPRRVPHWRDMAATRSLVLMPCTVCSAMYEPTLIV